ncbi:MAG: adenosine deaminase [Pseudomonadota bacterium]
MTNTARALPPMVDIHTHIEGAAHPAFVRAQAAKYNVDLSQIFADDGETYAWHDFTSFIAAYGAVSDVLRAPEDYIALTEDVLMRQAADGVIYQEFFCSHDNSDRMGCSVTDMWDAMAEGAARAKAATDIECRFITTGVRNIGMHHIDEAAKLAEKHPHPMVTGFGMAGDERMGRVAEVANAFERAQHAGLRLTAHAGELCGPQSVRDCLDHLKVERIGHGVRAVEDMDLVKRLAHEGIVLEVCPGSNIALNVFEPETHPLRTLHEAGVAVTVAADDPPFFATTTRAEYEMAWGRFGFSLNELTELSKVAIAAAFVDDTTRAKLFAKLEDTQTHK